MKLQELKLGYNGAAVHSDNLYTAIDKCTPSHLEDMWGRLVKSVEDQNINFEHLTKPIDTSTITRDRSMNILNRLNIINIEETTKEVKVPQHKAAPKRVTRKVVKVTFESGSVQEAICLEEDADKYNLRDAIQVCIMKEIFGGTKAYNDFLRKTIKDHEKRFADKKQKQENAEIAARRKAKNDKRKAKSDAKKKEAERQEKIDIQAQAILKALKMYDAFVVQEDAQNLDKLIENEINEWK